MKIIGINKAFNSMRFNGTPFDFLADLGGKTVLEHSIERMKKAKIIDEIIVVTSDNKEDDEIVRMANKCNVQCFRGQGEDYIIWVGQLYDKFKPDLLVENPHGSPLFDYESVDKLVAESLRTNSDITWLISPSSPYCTPKPSVFNPVIFKKFYDDKKNTLLPEIREIANKLSLEFKEAGKKCWADVLNNGGALYVNLFIEKKFTEFSVCSIETTGSLWEKVWIEDSNLRQLFWNVGPIHTRGAGIAILKEIYKKFYDRKDDCIDLNHVFESLSKNPELIRLPSHLVVELTTDSNLDCIYCPRHQMTRKKGTMDLKLFEKILDEAEKNNINQIDFSLMGEPLLHPEFVRIIKMCKERGIEVGLYTNGINLTKNMAKAILDCEVKDMIINLPAATAATYKKITGKDRFEEVTANIDGFLQLKKEKVNKLNQSVAAWWTQVRPRVGVQILKMQENDHEIEEFMNKWDFQGHLRKKMNWYQKKLAIKAQLKPLEEELDRLKVKYNWEEENQNKQRLLIKPSEIIDLEVKISHKYQRLINSLWTAFWEEFYNNYLPLEYAIIGHFNRYCDQIQDRSVADFSPLPRFPCRQIQEGMAIFWDGNVTMCQQDFDGKYVAGNIKEESLLDIWHRYRKLRILQINEKYDQHPLCAKCKEWYIPLK